MATPTSIFVVLVGLAVAAVVLLLLWKLAKLALKIVLVGGLLLIVLAAVAIVFLGSTGR